MDFIESARVAELTARLRAFMESRVYPAESRFAAEVEANRRRGNPWVPSAVIEELKREARAQGLWNLWLPRTAHDAGLTNLEYAPLCEIMGRSVIGPETFNCSAPDTGNMEVLLRYGSEAQKRAWLAPLLEGTIRSAFAMTEPGVASSDATNIESRIERDGDDYVLNGRKWWTSGAGDPRCAILIFMGKSDPDNPDRHRQQSMILVPRDSPGVTVLRQLPVFGYDDAPHGHSEVLFENVRVPASNLLLGEGRGFEIAQGRLGPGRIHHCMRLIGTSERALEALCRRAAARTSFGRQLSEQGVTRERIAEARIMIDQVRLLVLHAAWKMDVADNKAAQNEIAMIKVAAPNVACRVLDWAIQVFGAAGVSDDFGLAYAYASARTLRLADGPDEVHRNQIARFELARHAEPDKNGSEPIFQKMAPSHFPGRVCG
jgi:acyl-CoA dehydrogenase